MSFFNFDSKEAGGNFDPLPPGEYEAIISEALVKTFNSGSEGIRITLTIRDDVEQEGGKRKIFDNLVAMPSTMFKFHNLSKGLMWAEGESAESLKDYANKVQFQPVRVKLKVKPANGQYAAGNDVVTYLPSEVSTPVPGGVAAGGGDPFAQDGKAIDISDDDLPF